MSVARWLLEHGANVDLPLGEGSRSTPLHGAVFHDHTDVVELLLSYHADVTIRNTYGATVFDECQSDLARAMLESYRDRLGDSKLIALHIYQKHFGERSNEQPIARLSLSYEATDRDLMEALRPFLEEQTGYFTLAGRTLHFEEEDPTILTAVYRARYSDSRFIETPLHLTFCAGFLRPLHAAARPRELNFDYARLEGSFQTYRKSYHIETKKGTPSGQIYCIDDLRCSFVTDSNEDDLSVDLQLLPLPCPDDFDLPECLALFKISCSSASASKARVKATHRSGIRCRLYVSAAPSPHWLTTGLDHRQLPMVNGIYGLFRSVDIIPGLLSLPLDMCMAQSIDQPLLPRATPIPCKCLQLRPHRPERFPLIVYHGTLISHIRSILTDGLVLPETVVSSGHFVKPPTHHVPLHTDYGHVRNFAGAIFVSPSIFYSSASTYATEFQFEGAIYLPVLECSIKTDSYTVFARTVPTYIGHADDNLEALEWRIADPSDIEINAVLFVKKNFARNIKASSRMTWL